jgi:predicted O-methyltransferase YrrM
VYDLDNFRLWERRGYHITPVHFYSPIPDTRELRDHYPSESPMQGIDLRTDEQRALLRDVLAVYEPELAHIATRDETGPAFFMANDAFRGIDPYIYYALIRHLRPATVIEVGSGFSTLLAAEAVATNGVGEVICVDPWPRDFIAAHTGPIRRICERVEALDTDLFASLQANDMLFIDSSHVVRTGGDVAWMVLSILPLLRPGVLIHFHDIYLPDDYPFDVVVTRRQFWTEQYLVQAYLIENEHAQVLFGSNHMVRQHPADLRACFPTADAFGASFWIRKQ